MTQPTAGLYRGFDTSLQYSMRNYGMFLGKCMQKALPDWRYLEQYDKPCLFNGRTIESTANELFKIDRYLIPRRRFGGRRLDLLAISDHSDAYISLGGGASRTIITCHDVLPRLLELGLVEGRKPSGSGRLLMRLNGRAMARADRVICVSNSTRRDLTKHFDIDPSRVEVIHNCAMVAMEGIASEAPAPAIERSIADSRPYIFSVGGGKFYKNLRIIPQVLRRLVDSLGLDVRWIVVGERDFDTSGCDERVEFFPAVAAADMVRLYRSAGAFFFPSLYEGFGLPVLEAQIYGAPVVCSDRGALPEVVGQGGIVVPPHDHERAADALANILVDNKLRGNLIGAGRLNVQRFTEESRTDLYVSALIRTARE